MSNQAQSNSNTQDDAKAQKRSSTINTTALAYLGEIRQGGGNGKPVAYYIDVSLLAGEDGKGKTRYQYMSLRVSKNLVASVEEAFNNQVTEQGKPAKNSLTNVLMKVDIYGSFFSAWNQNDKFGVNGEGVLMDFEVSTSGQS